MKTRWPEVRLGSVSTIRNCTVDKKLHPDEFPVRLANYTDIYNNEQITDSLDFMPGTATASEIERFSLRSGDVLITKDSEDRLDIGVAAFVPETLENVLCGYHLAQLRSADVIGGYLAWAFRSHFLKGQLDTAANGVTRFGLTLQAIGSLRIPLPPLEVQKRIAAFLDEETAKIDNAIERNRRLIDLLDEKRSALISHTVTTGLDPDVPTKPTDIPWLGEIPEHWEVVQLGRVIVSIGSGSTPRGGAERYVESGIQFLRSQNVRDGRLSIDDVSYVDHETANDLTPVVRTGDVLLNITGASLGRSAVANTTVNGARVNQHVAVIRGGTAVSTTFLSYFLNGQPGQHQIWSLQGGSAREGLNSDAARSIRIPLPPLPEQQEIADYLDRETARIDKLKEQLERQIDLLTEKRQALITAAVTGEVEV